MTPKEKAEELLRTMHIKNNFIFFMSKSQAKICALKSIREIMYLCNKFQKYEEAIYWKKVREELLNL
jgi:hypothetical protein